MLTGLILAGGRGSRMGGCDKGLVVWNGRPLVTWVAERLRPQVGSLLLSANRSVDSYRALGLIPLLDQDPLAFRGPLAGIRQGLIACQTDWLLVSPCDTPIIPHDLAERLLRAVRKQNAMAAFPVSADGRSHPGHCLVHRSLLGLLDEWMGQNHGRLHTWLGAAGAVAVPFDDSAAFQNLNTPDDLASFGARSPSILAASPSFTDYHD